MHVYTYVYVWACVYEQIRTCGHLYMCVYTCACTRRYVCTWMYIRVCVYVYGQICPCIRVHTCVRACECVYMRVDMPVHMYIRVSMPVCLCVRKNVCVNACIYVCIYVCECVCVFTSRNMRTCIEYTCVCVWVRACVRACTSWYVRTRKDIHVCMYVCMYVCVCMCVRTSTHLCVRVFSGCLCFDSRSKNLEVKGQNGRVWRHEDQKLWKSLKSSDLDEWFFYDEWTGLGGKLNSSAFFVFLKVHDMITDNTPIEYNSCSAQHAYITLSFSFSLSLYIYLYIYIYGSKEGNIFDSMKKVKRKAKIIEKCC